MAAGKGKADGAGVPGHGGDGAEVAEDSTQVVEYAAAIDVAKGSGMVCTLWGSKRGTGGWPASMPAVVAAGLARSRACDSTDAVSDFHPAGRMDGAAGAFGGVEGCRAAGAAP